jgi:hypothetical protein
MRWASASRVPTRIRSFDRHRPAGNVRCRGGLNAIRREPLPGESIGSIRPQASQVSAKSSPCRLHSSHRHRSAPSEQSMKRNRRGPLLLSGRWMSGTTSSRAERHERGGLQTPIDERTVVKRGGADFELRASAHPFAVGFGRFAPSQITPRMNGCATRNTSSEPEAGESILSSWPAVYEAIANLMRFAQPSIRDHWVAPMSPLSRYSTDATSQSYGSRQWGRRQGVLRDRPPGSSAALASRSPFLIEERES